MGNAEEFIRLTVKEQGFNADIDELPAPVGTRYEENGPPTPTTFRIGQATRTSRVVSKLTPKAAQRVESTPKDIRVGYDPKGIRTTTLLVAGSVFLFTIITILSLLTLSLYIVGLAIGLVLYGFYFCCMRPLWIWSDSRRVAHVLWIEEVSPGVYQRIGVGEIKYSALKKLTPQLRKIKLV